MSGRIIQLLALIVSFTNDPAILNNDRTDRNFFLIERDNCKVERLPHPRVMGMQRINRNTTGAIR